MMEIIAKNMTSKVTMFYSAYSRIFLILLQLGFNDKPVTKRLVTAPCATGPLLGSYPLKNMMQAERCKVVYYLPPASTKHS